MNMRQMFSVYKKPQRKYIAAMAFTLSDNDACKKDLVN